MHEPLKHAASLLDVLMDAAGLVHRALPSCESFEGCRQVQLVTFEVVCVRYPALAACSRCRPRALTKLPRLDSSVWWGVQAISGVLFPIVSAEGVEPRAEALQHCFVRSGCIQVMLDAVAAVVALPSSGEGIVLLQ